METGTFETVLERMQALATRTWTPTSWQHAGQLAWSRAFAEPSGPVVVWTVDGLDVAWAWAEADDWVELCVDPARADLVDEVVAHALALTSRPTRTLALSDDAVLAGALGRAGFEVEEGPWFRQHLLDLAQLPGPRRPAGYRLRSVHPDETVARAACHRAAWSDTAPSQLSAARYERVQRTPSYDAGLDWVAVSDAGELVASCLVHLAGAVALVEPVGCALDHRGRGLAGAVSLAALHAARERGARTAVVRPRDDDAYPGPGRLYRSLGFRAGGRTTTWLHR